MSLYHLYSASEAPSVELNEVSMEKLALELISKHGTVTGVQKRLCLNLSSEGPKKQNRLTIVVALG